MPDNWLRGAVTENHLFSSRDRRRGSVLGRCATEKVATPFRKCHLNRQWYADTPRRVLTSSTLQQRMTRRPAMSLTSLTDQAGARSIRCCRLSCLSSRDKKPGTLATTEDLRSAAEPLRDRTGPSAVYLSMIEVRLRLYPLVPSKYETANVRQRSG